MKILILDDFQERHDKFKQQYIGCDLTHVYTATECMTALSKTKYDIVQLDHDLEGYFVKDFYAEENTGTKVSEFIRDSLDKDMYPHRIIIHSWNPDGARRMQNNIREVGISVVYIPFR